MLLQYRSCIVYGRHTHEDWRRASCDIPMVPELRISLRPDELRSPGTRLRKPLQVVLGRGPFNSSFPETRRRISQNQIDVALASTVKSAVWTSEGGISFSENIILGNDSGKYFSLSTA